MTAWPAVGAGMRQQWVWLVMIVLFGPLAGLLWFFLGRRTPNHVGQPRLGSQRSKDKLLD